MKKIVLFLLVCLLCTSACTKAGTKPLYDDFIRELAGNSREVYYSVKDIDGDRTEDLIVLRNTALSVYTYTDEVMLVGEHDFMTGTVRFFYSDKEEFPGIFYFTVGGGLNHYGYMTVQNGALHLEQLWDEDYSGATDWEDHVAEFSDDKALIQQSKALYEADKDIVFSLSSHHTSDAETCYTDFIAGKIAAVDRQGQPLNIQDLSNGEGVQYAFYDMNGDDVAELLIKSTQQLTIFRAENGAVTVWHECTG